MEFLLIRHAEPDWVPGGFGVNEPTLTELGWREAESLAAALESEKIAGQKIDELWVSPARRSRDTAQPVAAALALEPQIMDWLMEAGTPDWEGHPAAEVMTVLRTVRGRSIAQWWAGFQGAEPLREFVARVATGLDGQLLAHGAVRSEDDGLGLWRSVPRQRRIAIVSHAGTTGALIAHLLGVSQVPWNWERFPVPHASITRIKSVPIADDVIFSLRVLGDASHVADGSGLGFLVEQA